MCKRKMLNGRSLLPGIGITKISFLESSGLTGLNLSGIQHNLGVSKLFGEGSSSSFLKSSGLTGLNLSGIQHNLGVSKLFGEGSSSSFLKSSGLTGLNLSGIQHNLGVSKLFGEGSSSSFLKSSGLTGLNLSGIQSNLESVVLPIVRNLPPLTLEESVFKQQIPRYFNSLNPIVDELREVYFDHASENKDEFEWMKEVMLYFNKVKGMKNVLVTSSVVIFLKQILSVLWNVLNVVITLEWIDDKSQGEIKQSIIKLMVKIINCIQQSGN